MNEIIIIIALILFNGILAMSEISLISAKKSRLAGEAKLGNKSAKTALKLIGDPDKFLSTVQIGITIIGILTGIYSGSVLADDLAVIFIGWGIVPSAAHTVAQSTIVILVTYFTLIFGELVPKRIGMSISDRAAKIIARPMYFLSMAASPFVWLLSKSTSLVFNLLGLQSGTERVTEEEIKSMIQEGTKDGEVQEVEQDIVERVFLLGDLKVCSLMTHRSDVVALDINMGNERIKEIVKQDLYDVYPVIDRSFDNVVGVVTLRSLVFMSDDEKFDLRHAVLPPEYIHESMSVYKVLERMKEKRVNYALVFDEFGSCQGIVTLKDILEGLVGSIQDSNEEPDIIKRTDCEQWLVDGQCALHDFLSYFEAEHLFSTDYDFNTVGGLVLRHLEHIPRTGESMVWRNFSFEIIDMDGARIDKILVTVKKDNE